MSDAADTGATADLWADVVGQQEAVRQLRSAAQRPVHAYLLVGPEGSGKRAAARAFAAELLAHGLDDHGVQRTRRLVGAEAHPSLIVVERDGARISKEQADEVIRMAAMAPPEGDRQVFVLVDLHLVDVAGPQLLKTIEEPPEGTYFVALAETVPPELATIASRCVRVDLTSVPTATIVGRLLAEGVSQDVAAAAAQSSGGSISRARLLARDPAVAERRRAWYEAPGRLDGTGAAALTIADELLSSIDDVMEPLAELHREELQRFVAPFESAGVEPLKKDLKRVEDRHKREQRRVRADELRSGLAALVERYRDDLTGGAVDDHFVEVATSVQALCDGLAFNPNEGLQLRALLLRCPALGPDRRP